MKIKWLPMLALFWMGTLFAQSPNILLKATQQKLNRADIKETISLRVDKSYENGFSIQLPNASAIVPFRVALSGSNLWLKENGTIPLKANHLHWQSHKDRIQIVFAAGTLHSGQEIEIEMKAFIPDSETFNSDIYVYLLSKDSQNRFIPGALLGQIRPQELK